MLTISKSLSSGQAQSYHKLEFTSDAQSYYKQGETVKGEWQGRLSASGEEWIQQPRGGRNRRACDPRPEEYPNSRSGPRGASADGRGVRHSAAAGHSGCPRAAEQQERRPENGIQAREAITFPKQSLFEREAVADERTLMRDALRRSMGEANYREVRSEFEVRRQQGEFRLVDGPKYSSGRSFTTPETIAAERANVRHVLEGRNSVEPILTAQQTVSTDAGGRDADLAARPDHASEGPRAASSCPAPRGQRD